MSKQLRAIVLEREPELRDRLVASIERRLSVTAEIMIGALQISLRSLERVDRFPDFRVPLTGRGFPRWNTLLNGDCLDARRKSARSAYRGCNQYGCRGQRLSEQGNRSKHYVSL